MVCSLLRTGDIMCGHRRVRSVEEFGGPFEIWVASIDLDAARQLLATVET